jgi:DNA-binding GntR family transcriptional regulator
VSQSPVEPQTDTRVERASRLLRQGILSGALQQGLRLSEVRLAKEFGLSRGPIREALRGLEHEGLVTSVPNRATFVRRVTPIQVLEALEVRALLEPAAYDASRKRRGDALAPSLLQVTTEMRTRLDGGDLAALAGLHGRFHTVLYTEAPNRLLARAWEQVERVIELHVLSSLDSMEAGRELVDVHARLVVTLFEGTVAQGRQAILAHLERCAKQLEIPYYDGDLGSILDGGLHGDR